MDAITPIDVSSKHEILLEIEEPITGSQSPIVSIFFKALNRDTSLDKKVNSKKIAAKKTKKAKKPLSGTSLEAIILPEIIQFIFCSKNNSFMLKSKEDVLFHITATEAKIVVEGWHRYNKYLAEEAARQKTHAIKKQRYQDQKDSQLNRFIYENEDIRKQEVRHDIQSEDFSTSKFLY